MIYGLTLPKHKIFTFLGKTLFDWDMSICPFCYQSFSKIRGLSIHMELKHNHTKIYQQFYDIWWDATKHNYKNESELNQYLMSKIEGLK